MREAEQNQEGSRVSGGREVDSPNPFHRSD